MLLSSGEADRTALRTRKAVSKEGDKTSLDPVSVAIEARVYYSRVMKRNEKRPKKVLDHKVYPTLGVWYLCIWSDVGYAGQDVEEWKPADYAMQFHGLVETYRQVIITIIRGISLFNYRCTILHPPYEGPDARMRDHITVHEEFMTSDTEFGFQEQALSKSEVYEVRRIVERRRNEANEWEYLTQWKFHSDETWETAATFRDNAMSVLTAFNVQQSSVNKETSKRKR